MAQLIAKIRQAAKPYELKRVSAVVLLLTAANAPAFFSLFCYWNAK